MITEHQTSEEVCNLLVQSLVAKDRKLLLKVLEIEDAKVVDDIINHIPVNHLRKLIIELSSDLTADSLRWLHHILALKYSAISSMADGRSILLPLLALIEDRISPEYNSKLQSLKAKLTLLKQLKEVRNNPDTSPARVVRKEPDEDEQMESETDTD